VSADPEHSHLEDLNSPTGPSAEMTAQRIVPKCKDLFLANRAIVLMRLQVGFPRNQIRYYRSLWYIDPAAADGNTEVNRAAYVLVFN